ncbi:hypothetical protein TrLO_g12284 [Triparma laevis f. longispina]|uniref:Uncharacterized protein n=1 Tax=Triparma laevis f. longispina TaxID=1714387 RepID=A0A9W7FQC4_9STRA|nr:hypothetical protein TrLO_g12284 [Triparma laevis f. longispina]
MEGDPLGQICYNAYALFRKSFIYILSKTSTPLERPLPPRDGDNQRVQEINKIWERKKERVLSIRMNPIWGWTRVYWINAGRYIGETFSSPTRTIAAISGAFFVMSIS